MSENNLMVLIMVFGLPLLAMVAFFINSFFSRPEPLIIEYAEILHTYGVDSYQAKKFIENHSDDKDFLRCARTLNRLVRKFK